MKKYTNNIEMFDAFLNGSMSEEDKLALEHQLEQDNTLRQELLLHKELVYCLQKSCMESDSELELALRSISDDDFIKIVTPQKHHNTLRDERTGRNRSQKPLRSGGYTLGRSRSRLRSDGHSRENNGRMVPLKKIYQWLSIAAMVFIIAGVGAHQYQSRQSLNRAYDAIYATGFDPCAFLASPRDEGEMTQIEKDFNTAVGLMDKDPDEAVLRLETIFDNNSPEAQGIKTPCGTALAYAYVKVHDIEKAKNTIQKVKQFNKGLLSEELVKLNRALDNL